MLVGTGAYMNLMGIRVPGSVDVAGAVYTAIDHELCGVFIDRFGKDITFRKAGQNRSSVKVDVAVSPQFFGWIMSLGADVKITAPDDVVAEVSKAAKAFAANYR